MNDFWGTLKGKMGPLPVWAWAGLFTILLALVLMRRNKKTPTSAAADQSNSDLGSASELANMFTVAGLMPYQGGDVYINTTTTANPPKTPTLPWQPPRIKPSATYIVKGGTAKDTTMAAIAKKYGVSQAALWKYNILDANRSKGATTSLLTEGPNKLKRGQSILIPPKGYK